MCGTNAVTRKGVTMRATEKDVRVLIENLEELLGVRGDFKKYRVGKAYLYTYSVRVGAYPYQISAKGSGAFYDRLSVFKYGVCAGRDAIEG